MERSPKLSEAVDFGINSTYLHAHMPKINSSSVKICESSQKVLKKFSKSSRPKILNCYPRRSNPACKHSLFPTTFVLRFVSDLLRVNHNQSNMHELIRNNAMHGLTVKMRCPTKLKRMRMKIACLIFVIFVFSESQTDDMSPQSLKPHCYDSH